ncbi:MAG: hypothetical protein ACXW27_02740 [Allosphingosinicella sp.]
MELEFTAGGASAEAELFIHLDLEGLAALLRAIEAAMSTGRGQLTSPVCVGGGAADGFGKVTVTFADRTRPSDDGGPFSLPDAGLARGLAAPVLNSGSRRPLRPPPQRSASAP